MKLYHSLVGNLNSTLATVLVLILFATGQAYSQEDQPTPEERAYKFRTSLFQTFGWKFGQLIGAKAQDDEAAFIKNAKDLEYLAGMLEEGFQIKDSLPEGTTAKANIWEDFETFSEKAQTLRAGVNALTQDGAMADFNPKEFGSKTCGNCHREFRIKKDG
jgi:Cytochrome c556